MKRVLTIFCAAIFFFGTCLTVSSCNKDAHCPAYDSLHSKSSKKGLSTKKGKTKLFPKNMK